MPGGPAAGENDRHGISRRRGTTRRRGGIGGPGRRCPRPPAGWLTVSFTRNADLPMPERAVCDAGPRTAGQLHDALIDEPADRPCGASRVAGAGPSAGQAVRAPCGGLPRGLRLGRLRVGALAVTKRLETRGRYGSGSGSRSNRFTLSSRPARSAATASGSWRAALAMMPISESVAAVEVPPAEMSGSCRPVTGSSPIT